MSAARIGDSPAVGGVSGPLDRLIVFDTTLRDGEQSPGVHLSESQKVEIAFALSRLGVDVCEIGFPACAADLHAVNQIVTEVGSYVGDRPSGEPMTLAVLARCVKSDIDAAWEVIRHAKKPRIHVFYATSDIHLQYKLKKTRAQALESINTQVRYAKSFCSDVEFSAEDASRTDFDFLVQVVITAIEAGATTINIPDTVGYMQPHEYGELYLKLKIKCAAHFSSSGFLDQIIFSTHCHNDLGLAVANTVSAIRNGARQVEVTINGIGERAGNAALEEVIMNLRVRPDVFPASLIHQINLKLLVPTSQLVEKYTGMIVQKNKAIVGANSFLHESGVHADGVLKNRATYEIYHAEEVGWPSTASHIVLGKHSGRAAYKQALADGGFTFGSEQQLADAFQRFQQVIQKLASGQAPSWQQILQTATEVQDGTQHTQQSKETSADVASSSSSSSASAAASHNVAAGKAKDPNVFHIVELIGDGVSVEVTSEAVKVLQAVGAATGKTFEFEQHPIGGHAIDLTGDPLPESTLSACKASDGVLLGAVGDSRFDKSKVRPEQGLLRIRSEMQLYQNIRPIFVYDQLMGASPFNPEVIRGTDFVIFRELTGGIYMNVHKQTEQDAHDIMVYTVQEIERVVRAAAELARKRKKKLVQVDKANVLACSRLWRSVTTKIIQTEFPDISLEHMLVDSTAMHMLKRPRDFDVLVMENLFGDILSDEAAALTASLGMLPSASIGHKGQPALYEPVHGSAPDIAGKGICNPFGTILAAAMMLRHSFDLENEAKAVEAAVAKCIEDGIVTGDISLKGAKAYSTKEVGKAVVERVSAYLVSSSSSALSTKVTPSSSSSHSMNLCEKILCHNAVGLTRPFVGPGDLIVCKVSRTLASEMTWVGMSETYNYLGKPNLWRKDRFWLAIDHTVDPSNYTEEKQKHLIDSAETFAKSVKLDDYMGPNETILHTEFYRQRVTPSTIVVGADSHSCSAGCVGAYATGLGAADVVMPVVTGQTFFQVPETLLVNFTGDLPFGLVGKDVMLFLLKTIGRNTLALERAVEFGGSIRSMSIDSRFALSNMATELGGIVGVFPADEVTAAFLTKRNKQQRSKAEAKLKIAAEEEEQKQKAEAESSIGDEKEKEKEKDDEDRGVYKNFRADSDAKYAARVTIDLSTVAPLIAKYPDPDRCYAIDDPAIDEIVPEVGRSIRKLDGAFIGACTTAEEEIILAGLVLDAAMKSGAKPNGVGTRKMTPGSRIMLEKLKRIGIVDIYQRAGFVISAPGCSMCLGVNGVDVAPKGTVWLSSQNRNFKNRMGPGSIGNLASAATVAASSFEMTITDPRPLLSKVDRKHFEELLEREPLPASVHISEPQPVLVDPSSAASTSSDSAVSSVSALPQSSSTEQRIPAMSGRIQRFGDNIDTDAIIPGQLMLERPLSKLGKYSFKHVRPEFVGRVSEGRNIVVGGEGFGCGSSREEAVSCLRACGVQAVIAKSYSFIFGRNLLCLNLIGIIIKDEKFYDLAVEDAAISINVEEHWVEVGGQRFTFEMNDIQMEIYRRGGIIEMYKQSGRSVFQQLAAAAKKATSQKSGCGSGGSCGSGDDEGASNKTKSAVQAW